MSKEYLVLLALNEKAHLDLRYQVARELQYRRKNTLYQRRKS